MRVVLDTVVLVRSLINPASSCGRLLHQRRHRFQPIITAAITTEYLSVLQRPAIARTHGLPMADVMSIVQDFIESAAHVDPPIVPRVCRAPNDDKFLAAAVAGGAAYIVSEDRDLLDLGRYEGITILSASVFLQVLDRARP